MKKILIIGLMALLVVSMVAAIDPLPRGKCFWTREATDYRPARDFQGVWGRMSDGSIKCFSPGNIVRATPVIEVIATPEPDPEPEPEPYVETCVNDESVCLKWEPTNCMWILKRGHPWWMCFGEKICTDWSNTHTCTCI